MKQNDIARVLEAHIAAIETDAPDAKQILGHIHSRRRTVRIRRRTLMIVVILLLTGMVAAGAVAPVLHSSILRDEDGDIVLSTGNDGPVSVSSRTYTDAHRAAWGDALIDALEQYGCSLLLPTWTPEGFGEAELSVLMDEHGDGCIYSSSSNGEDQYLTLIISLLPTAIDGGFGRESSYSMNEGEEPRLYEIEGREVRWGKNIDMDMVFWLDVSGEVCITGGPFGDDRVEKMIGSIQ